MFGAYLQYPSSVYWMVALPNCHHTGVQRSLHYHTYYKTGAC